MEVSGFFGEQFPAFAIYDLYRSVGSYVDGLKPSQRKVAYTVARHRIDKSMKVAQLCSRVAEETQYLHGENNLVGVIVGMAQTFVGTNNLNLLVPDGNFGNRAVPEAAAGRYIFTHKSEHFDRVFNPEDFPLLPKQTFEGDEIEPIHFVPTLPLILVNGNEGIGTGWSQKILPRNRKDIEKAIRKYLEDGKLPKSIPPYFEGFKGRVVKDEEEPGRWQVYGAFERAGQTRIRITELPIGYTLDRYNKILGDLWEEKVILDYHDLSDPRTNKFEFTVSARRDFVQQDDAKVFKALKLVTRMTENFTCMDENNRVREFKDEVEILKAYIDIRMDFYQRRKDSIVQELQKDINYATNRHCFVRMIVDKKIDIMNKPKKETVDLLTSIEMATHEGSYDYLLNMPIHSLTTDTLDALKRKIDDLKARQKVALGKTVADMWTEDLK